MSSKNKKVRVHISIPLHVKEVCAQAGSKLGISVSEVIALAAREFARDTIGFPSKPSTTTIPTVSDVLKSYVDGTGDRLIGPCGEPYPCAYDPDASETVGNMEFCNSCGIRVG